MNTERRRFLGLSCFILMTFLVFSISVVSAAVINVPGDYSTIQAAINHASNGDTINVGEGNYNENQILINKTITIHGANRDTTIIDGSDATLISEGLIRITATGNVTFSGFTIRNAGGPINGGDDSDNKDNFAMLLDSSSSSATYTIMNNKIYGRNIPEDYSDFGVYASNGGKESLVFTNNIVSQTGNNNILIERVQGSTDISYNTLDVGDWGTTAIFYMTYSGTDITTLQKVSFNNIDMSSGGPFDEDHACSAISFSGSYRNYPDENLGNGRYTNVEITDNKILNIQSYRGGIALADMDSDGNDGSIVNAQILRNNITGISTTETKGIRLAGLIKNANIQKNEIKGLGKSFYGQNSEEFATDATDYPTGTEINYNSFVNNAEGLVWEGTTTLDAENNWWGSCDGPSGVGTGHGDSVSAHVDYSSWIVKGVCITGKVDKPCGAFGTDNIILSANLTANETEIDSVWFSYTINGVNHNKTASYVGGNKYQITIPSSELVGGQNITWNVYANDSIKIYKNGEKTFHVREKTSLTVNPLTPDGLNGWYINEPEFSLTKDSHGGNIYYQWDSGIKGPFQYTGTFGLENIPNLPKETAGILELKWWTDFGTCGNETKQNQTFKIDLTDPQVKNMQPANGSTVYNNPRPKIYAYLDDVYGSNSGINLSSIIMKLNGNPVNANVSPIGTKNANVSYLPTTNLPAGKNNVTIDVTDKAGRNSEVTWSFIIELPPTFNLNVFSPEDKTYGKSKILFNLSSNNSLAKIEYIDLSEIRPRWTKLCDNCNTKTYQKAKTFSEGKHDITIRATDYYSQIIEKNVSFTIDTKKPKITKTEPGKNDKTNGKNFYIKYTEENLRQIFVYLNDSTKINITNECNEKGTNKECTFDLDLSAYNGKYIEYWIGVSDDLNETKSKPTKVFVDTIPPELRLNKPIDGDVYTNKRVIFNVEMGKPVTLEYIDNSASRPSWRTLCTKCSSYGFSSSKTQTFSYGIHNIAIRATDEAGNIDEESLSFEVKK